MFDVFTDEIEILIKDGIANLYWYKGDLHKAWLRSGITVDLQRRIAQQRDEADKGYRSVNKWTRFTKAFATKNLIEDWKYQETSFAFS